MLALLGNHDNTNRIPTIITDNTNGIPNTITDNGNGIPVDYWLIEYVGTEDLEDLTHQQRLVM